LTVTSCLEEERGALRWLDDCMEDRFENSFCLFCLVEQEDWIELRTTDGYLLDLF
jgi:hypothetical protein